MNIRYSYSPSFEQGWAVGIWLDANVLPGKTTPIIDSGRLITVELGLDACAQLDSLSDILPRFEKGAELKPEELQEITEVLSQVRLHPVPYPWATFDGARGGPTN